MITIFAFVLYALAGVQNGPCRVGPMVTTVGDEARVWCRADGVSAFLRYREVGASTWTVLDTLDATTAGLLDADGIDAERAAADAGTASGYRANASSLHWRLAGLSPATVYEFEIVDAANSASVSMRPPFRTSPAEEEPFCVALIGDYWGGLDVGQKATVGGVWVNSLAAVAAEDPAIVFTLGDRDHSNDGDEATLVASTARTRFLKMEGDTHTTGSPTTGGAWHNLIEVNGLNVFGVWDDHDFSVDDALGLDAYKPIATQVFNEFMPTMTSPGYGPDARGTSTDTATIDIDGPLILGVVEPDRAWLYGDTIRLAPWAESTSTSTMTVATGAQSMVVANGPDFPIGARVRVLYSSTKYMDGNVTSNTGGSLGVNVTTIVGSGTKAAWTITTQESASTYIDGIVLAYDSIYDEVTVRPTYIAGDGTYSKWKIAVYRGIWQRIEWSPNVWFFLRDDRSGRGARGIQATDDLIPTGNTIDYAQETALYDFLADAQAAGVEHKWILGGSCGLGSDYSHGYMTAVKGDSFSAAQAMRIQFWAWMNGITGVGTGCADGHGPGEIDNGDPDVDYRPENDGPIGFLSVEAPPVDIDRVGCTFDGLGDDDECGDVSEGIVEQAVHAGYAKLCFDGQDVVVSTHGYAGDTRQSLTVSVPALEAP